MIYNLLLYFGIFSIVGGFSLFLYSEYRLREIDIQLFKLNQKIEKELNNVKNWCSYYLCFLYYLNDLLWFNWVGDIMIDKIISKAKTLHTNDIQTIICSLQIEIDEREEKDE